MRSLVHVTLDTGHSRQSRRDEVAEAVLPVVQGLLSEVLAGGQPRVPGVPGEFTLTGAREGPCLLVTVWGPGGSLGTAPIVTIGVARDAGVSLWRMLHESAAARSAPIVTDPDAPPPAPWCAARLEVGTALYPEAMEWLGDFERCLAWAWLERQ